MSWYENPLSAKIAASKYFHPGEVMGDFITRVCALFPEKLNFTHLFSEGYFCPAGRALYALGARGKFKVTTSNCYIMPAPEDNLESIYKVNQEMARIYSYGGGVGVDISRLRPRGSKVNNAARTSTGAVSFLKIFDCTGEVISQNGRRGAMIVGLRVDHPDIMEFIDVKNHDAKLASMNISVLFTDEFMQAVEQGKSFPLHFHVDATGEDIDRTVDARQLFQKFCETQWDWGDPGALFIDRINNYSLVSEYPNYEVRITNPCGEYCGNEYNACNLGSLNIYNFVEDKFTSEAHLNYELLEAYAERATTALNYILDYGYEDQPLAANKKCITDWHAIGLGIMGLADAFVALKIRYGSKESREVASHIMRSIMRGALRSSVAWAKEHGTFAEYKYEHLVKSALYQTLVTEGVIDEELSQEIKAHGLANATLLSIAPTGTISLLFDGVSGGAEPLYKISYERTTHKMEEAGKTFHIYAKSVWDLLVYEGKEGENLAPEAIKAAYPFVVDTYDVAPSERVALQATLQRYVDNSISSTVNLPEAATVAEIKAIYKAAWRAGCKGITIFRDNCKRGNILGVEHKVDTKAQEVAFGKRHPIARKDIPVLQGITVMRQTACVDRMYTTVNHLPSGDIFEVFTNASGGCQSNIATITRLISCLLRCGVDPQDVIHQLKLSACPACQALIRKGQTDISLSCGYAIGSSLEQALELLNKTQQPEKEFTGLECPQCHELTLKPEGKCASCSNCGYSKCE